MKITLKDGSVFEGTAKEYAELVKLGEGNAETEEVVSPKFEAGDYVVALPSADENYSITTTEMQLGEVKEVQDDFIDIKIVAHRECKGRIGDIFFVESKYFRKATDEEVAKFKNEYTPKEGDIVVITGNTNHSRNKVGDIGKVGETDRNTAIVNVPSRPYSPGVRGNNTLYEEMRPAMEEEKVKYYAELNKLEFKAGDYARIKLGVKHDGYAGGDVVKLYENSGGYCDFKIVKLGESIDGDYTFFNACDLEKVSEEELKFAKLGRKLGEFKKGDLVRYTGGPSLAGIIVEVEGDSESGRTKVNFKGTGYGICTESNEDLELIAPVESRVDFDD